MNRQPFIVGATADKVLGLLAGMIGFALGVIATIVVMFLWAGSDPAPEVEERRRHATSVSIWSGIGCALPAILVLVLILGVVSVGTHSFGGYMDPNAVPFRMP